MPVPEILCGVSGWTHSHWDSLVYPDPKPRGFHSLEYLAQHLDAIEISSSFREDVRPELSRVWARKVSANPRLQFTAKLHRRFTHERELDRPAVESWSAGLLPLLERKRLSSVLMQFPWSFRYTAENRKYLIELRRAFHEFPLVAEMRHSSWMLDEALGTLIDYRIGFCNIDQPEFTKAMPATSFLTSATGYVRLHGRNCFNWYNDAPQGHRYDYLYSEAELSEWRARVEKISVYSNRTFVIFNNDAGGKAFFNALQFRRMLTGEDRPIPEAVAKKAAAGRQTGLFTTFSGKAVA